MSTINFDLEIYFVPKQKVAVLYDNQHYQSTVPDEKIKT